VSADALIARFDGAAHYYAVVCSGMRGEHSTRHGARDRWDWGRTLLSLLSCWERNKQMQRMVADMTLEQRDAVWSDPSPVAAMVRKAMVSLL
jgi:hypothetical protein